MARTQAAPASDPTLERLGGIFRAFVRELAKAVAAELRAGVDYSQDNLPPGIKTKRVYLDHCARGSWPNRKVGRLRLTSPDDFNDWQRQRETVRKPRVSADQARAHIPSDHELLHGPIAARKRSRKQ